MAAQLAPRVYDIASVHRFTDPAYAALTVQMRRGEDPGRLFDRLHSLGHVAVHGTVEEAQNAIARNTHDGCAITVATNDEARELNARIRAERVGPGFVDDNRTTTGSDGLSIGRGDVIQTRHNDSALRVANRQMWTVRSVGPDGSLWIRERATGPTGRRAVRLPAQYVRDHTHLAYASTAFGAQGGSGPEAHTVLSDSLDAAGVYVGMTRGRDNNCLHIVAADVDDAREQFALALERDRADRGLTRATATAREAVSGLAVDGPVRLVNAAKAKLRRQIRAAAQLAETSTGAQSAIHGMQASAARRALAELENLPIDRAAAQLLKAAGLRRQRPAHLPDVTSFGRRTTSRTNRGLSR